MTFYKIGGISACQKMRKKWIDPAVYNKVGKEFVSSVQLGSISKL